MARKDIPDKLVCQAYQQYREGGMRIRPAEWLQQETRQPVKVCWAAMERADRRGLVDYGVNLDVGWLTDKGKQLLL